MPEVDLPYERLVPGGEAIEQLAREHDRRNLQPTWPACVQAAHDTILARILAGHLVAYAETCEIDCDNPQCPTPTEIIRQEDFYRGSGFVEIPGAFWCHYHSATTLRRSFDLVSGDFTFSFPGGEWDSHRWRTGGAYSVAFDRVGLPYAARPPRSPEIAQPKTDELFSSPAINRGRRPANWWPAFAEELAFQVHENGLPETQKALIAAVFDGLAQRGNPEPGRTQIQPVIRGLFERMDRAGK